MEARTKYLYFLMLYGIVAIAYCQTVVSSITNTPQSQCEWLCITCINDSDCISGELCLDSCPDGYYTYRSFLPEQCDVSSYIGKMAQDEVPGQSSVPFPPTTIPVTSTTTSKPLVFCRKCNISGCSNCQDEEDQKCQTCQEGYVLLNTSGQCHLLDQAHSEQLAPGAIAGIVIGTILVIVVGIAVAIFVLRMFRGSGHIADHFKIEKNQDNGCRGRTESKELDQMGLAPPPPFNPYTDMKAGNDKSYDPLDVQQSAGPTEDYSPLKEDDCLDPQLQRDTTETENIYVNAKDKHPGPSSGNQSAGRDKSGFLAEKGINRQVPEVRAQGSVDVYEDMETNKGSSCDVYMNQESLALVESVLETEDDIYVNDNGGDDVYQNQ